MYQIVFYEDKDAKINLNKIVAHLDLLRMEDSLCQSHGSH